MALAARDALPAMYQSRDLVAMGGLMSYGPSLPDLYRQMGVYVGKVLGGTNPGELPIIQPTKFELAINENGQGARPTPLQQCSLAR